MSINTLNDLPLEILEHIAFNSTGCWGEMITIPNFGRYTLSLDVQQHALKQFTVMTIDADGDKEWKLNGQLHRDDDLPAVECADGSKYWYRFGKRYREGGKPTAESTKPAEDALWYTHSRSLFKYSNRKPLKITNQADAWYRYPRVHRDDDQFAVILN